MSQTRPNKGKTPTNSDAWNLAADLATMADSLNVVIRVASQSERDALTKDAGLIVCRTDITGEPLEVCNGTGWDRQVSPTVQANSNMVGSGMANNAFTTGTLRPFIQAGTYVGTTDGAGNLQIIYPVVFPNGVISQVACSGDNAALGNGGSIQLSAAFTQTTSSLYVNASTSAGAKINSTIRVNWIAVGW